MTVIGPFSQLVTMNSLPQKGPIADEQLEVLDNAAVLCRDGMVEQVGFFEELARKSDQHIYIEDPTVALPGLIDCHTHICFAGSRAHDYTKRLSGVSYQQITSEGGGILDTVYQTRRASSRDLEKTLSKRIDTLVSQGVTTCEIKSGYGLTLNDEIKMLTAIEQVNQRVEISLIPTCLAAHLRPPEYKNNRDYLSFLLKELLPIIRERKLSNRIDIFVEETAFSVEEARYYLAEAIKMGFATTIHADQFTTGGSLLAAELKSLSADHLEVSSEREAKALAEANVIATVLPGATLGLGIPFPPARMLLDQGVSLAIASDWNPGSAPMGQLLLQAALLGANQKLTAAETLAGITTRAAQALNLSDRGRIAQDCRADLTLFPVDDYREILYHQGSIQPCQVFSLGKRIYSC